MTSRSRLAAKSALALLALLGAAMTFDSRFVPFSDVIERPISGLYLFGPTLFFGIIAAVQLRRGRLWPATAFVAGLLATGMVHQSVADDSYGNPGYMFPGGHIVAPFVSTAAYALSLLVAWIIVKITSRSRRTAPQDQVSG